MQAPPPPPPAAGSVLAGSRPGESGLRRPSLLARQPRASRGRIGRASGQGGQADRHRVGSPQRFHAHPRTSSSRARARSSVAAVRGPREGGRRGIAGDRFAGNSSNEGERRGRGPVALRCRGRLACTCSTARARSPRHGGPVCSLCARYGEPARPWNEAYPPKGREVGTPERPSPAAASMCHRRRGPAWLSDVSGEVSRWRRWPWQRLTWPSAAVSVSGACVTGLGREVARARALPLLIARARDARRGAARRRPAGTAAGVAGAHRVWGAGC